MPSAGILDKCRAVVSVAAEQGFKGVLVFIFRRTRFLLVGVCYLISGCTVFPGLNISEDDSPRGHEYRIEKKADTNDYAVVKADGGISLEVLEITPEVIKQERAQMQALIAARELAPIDPSVVPPEYRIGPGDVVAVTVWDHPELTNPIGVTQDTSNLGHLVAANGTIFYPYIGVIKVAGKTTAELREEISNQLNRVITSPQVDVRVAMFRAGRIQVSGEVVNPGVVNLDDSPKGVVDAISERGGLTPLASRRRVILFRGGQAHEVDLASLMSSGRPSFNPALKAGDILQIPDKSGDQVFVLGEVAKQSPLNMQQDRMTLTEALTAAGGLDQLNASDSGVLVFRRATSADSPPRVFRLDMGNPIGLLLAGEFELEPRDVLYVKRTGFAKYNTLIAQIAPTVTAIYQLTYVDYLRRTP